MQKKVKLTLEMDSRVQSPLKSSINECQILPYKRYVTAGNYIPSESTFYQER